jgi:ribonucleoside-diphosphate reductase alpha chain
MTELPTLYQSFIHLSRYSRWLDDKGRRETWEETVQRYINFMYNHVKDNTKISKKDLMELYEILGAECEK